MAAGTYKRSLHGYHTFIPNHLPPQLRMPAHVERLIEQATHSLGQVEMCRELLPNANLLVYGSLRREALASSTIEGTIASADELIRYQLADQAEHGAVREVSNYAVALQWGSEQLHSRPITLNLILGLHERLLDGVRGATSAGRFKERQNYIGRRPSDPIDNAVFVPPPPEDVRDLVGDLENYVNAENHESRIVQCALTHYQFETIHPFNDGNGRVGRLLIILQFMQLGLLSAPLIYPSVFFERRREEYYGHLQAVRQDEAWNEWIEFFANAVLEQCGETIQLTRTLLELRNRLRREIGSLRRRAALNVVLDAFYQEPVQTVRQISQYANTGHTTIQPALDELQNMGIVYEITGRQKGRAYACRPIFDALFPT